MRVYGCYTPLVFVCLKCFYFFHHPWIISWLQNSRLTDFFPPFLPSFIHCFISPSLSKYFEGITSLSSGIFCNLKESENVSLSVFSYSLWPHGREPARLFPLEFSRWDYWSGMPFPPLEDLPDPEVESGSTALQADSLPSELREALQSSCFFWAAYCYGFLVPLPGTKLLAFTV